MQTERKVYGSAKKPNMDILFSKGVMTVQDIYYCPETSPLVLAPGNPSKGEELFRKGYFDDVCR